MTLQPRIGACGTVHHYPRKHLIAKFRFPGCIIAALPRYYCIFVTCSFWYLLEKLGIASADNEDALGHRRFVKNI
jgi:hypothetical protein